MNATRRRMSWMHRAPVRGLLLTLTLLFAPWSGTPAAEDTEQEIGRPVPILPGIKYCSSEVLLPDKDAFYTVRDGLLSEYQIKPFKRVRSVALELEQHRDFGRLSCWIRTTEDHSKVILYNYKTLLLLDANNGSLLNSSLLPDGMDIIYAEINGDEILLLVESESAKRNEGLGNKDRYQLFVWDLNTLRHKKSIQLGEHAGFYRNAGLYPGMSITDEKIYLNDLSIFVVLNRKNYTPELRATPASSLALYPDYNRLYFIAKQIFDFTQNKVIFTSNGGNTALIFNQHDRTYKEVNKMDGLASRMQSVKPVLGGHNSSRNSNAWMREGEIYPDMNNLSYRFYQYEAGEAIMMHCKSVVGESEKCAAFEMTPSVRKYMQMKVNEEKDKPLKEVKALPINDATFDKYYIKGVTD
ncbi:MAG: hypothetical protein B7Y40_03425 [Gammaproteobacteria bacterium 28-57-27]|nr:MAG: hypothetical protein B7Y40_03425 [Gammaproteobacteria bacterium 28-57-27]